MAAAEGPRVVVLELTATGEPAGHAMPCLESTFQDL